MQHWSTRAAGSSRAGGNGVVRTFRRRTVLDDSWVPFLAISDHATTKVGSHATQVPAGEQCVLQHVQTGSFLSSDKVPYMTLFGPEFEVDSRARRGARGVPGAPSGLFRTR